MTESMAEPSMAASAGSQTASKVLAILCIHEKHLPIFASAIQCLSKIGADLFIEVLQDALKMRTVTDSKQAFASVEFKKGFFDEFTPPKVGGIRCKLSLKCCHSVFRTIRNVSRLELSFEESIDFTLCFSLHCRFGVVKTYRLFYEDTEIYQAIFDSECASNSFICRARTLMQVFQHIHGTEEATFGANPEGLKVCSYFPVLNEKNVYDSLQTDLFIKSVEFESYQLGKPAELTICLKQLKALLFFCLQANVKIEKVSIFFEDGGMPLQLIAVPSSSRLVRCPFSAELVMATAQQFVQADSQTQSSQEPSSVPMAAHDDGSEDGAVTLEDEDSLDDGLPAEPTKVAAFDGHDVSPGENWGCDAMEEEDFVENSQEEEDEEDAAVPRKRVRRSTLDDV